MNLTEVFASFDHKRIAIIGDVMLDSYIIGKVHRMSPEAPVPVVLKDREDYRLGGAANVALNLKALGAEVFVCSVVGVDDYGQKIQDLFNLSSIHCPELFPVASRQTTVKTRVLSGSQHLLRIDQEDTHDLDEETAAILIHAVKNRIDQGLDALIFEDYNKGVLTEKVITEIADYAHAKHVITCVDPKKDRFFAYKHVTLFKPNLKEIREGLGAEINPTNLDSLCDASFALREKLHHSISLLTLSEHGVFVDDTHNPCIIPAHFRDIADVSGAGDTVIAVATLALCCGLTPQQVGALANLAGGLVCEHSGVVSVNKLALLNEALRLPQFHE